MWVTLLALLGSAEGLVRLDPLVDAPAGLIRGVRADDGDYSLFMGIPYAQVDKEHPFGAASPQSKFGSVFEAFDGSAKCPQVEEAGTTVVGTLDCLQLNVYVPNAASSRDRLPVLVWIHGGGFSYGSGSIYGPKYLVRHDIILVTLNYRLGPYGFLCPSTPGVPGNQGLKDQVLALRWLKENIAAFGGDVSRITVMGESAGGASIEYHLLSKNEKLFNQAIIQSSSLFFPGLLEDSGRQNAFRIAQHLGYEAENVSDAIAFLESSDVDKVIAAASELGIASKLCIEQFENIDSILTDHPIHLDSHQVRNTNILIGFNSKEDLASFANKPPEEFRNYSFEATLKRSFVYDEEFKQMEDIARRFYIGDEELSEALRDSLVDFSSDFNYAFSLQTSINKYLEGGAKAVYYYMFSYDGERNLVKKEENITLPGAAHADELGYLFDLSNEIDTPSAADQLMIDRITTLWANFVKYGNPTPEISELLPVKWSPITEDTFTYLDIDSELTVGSRPYHDRMAFWELFFVANRDKINSDRVNYIDSL